MMKNKKIDQLIPYMQTWDTGSLEDAFIAFCVDAIESSSHISERLYEAVSLVDESWFEDKVRRLIYSVVKKTLLEVDKNGFVMPGSIAIRADAMIMAGVVKTSEAADSVIAAARSSSLVFLGAYSYEILIESVIPLWRIKLIRRELRLCSEKIVDSLDETPSHDLIVNRIPALLEKQQSVWSDAYSTDSKSHTWKDTISELLQPLPEDNAVSTGISVLDQTIQGGIANSDSAYGGRLIVVAARPGMGKTTMAVTLATHLANTGHNVAFYSLEMPKKQIEYKAISCLDFLRMKVSGRIVDPIRMPQLQNRSYNDSQRARLQQLCDDGFIQKFDIFDKSYDAVSIAASIRLIARTRPALRGIFIDYLQLVDGCTGTDNDAVSIGVVTKSLKRVAVETGIDIILMSQVNRGVEQRSEKMPTLADLRGSGCIEQDADIVMFMFRPGYYDSDADPYELAVSVAKNRNGITGTLQCRIDLSSSVVFDRL